MSVEPVVTQWVARDKTLTPNGELRRYTVYVDGQCVTVGLTGKTEDDAKRLDEVGRDLAEGKLA